MLDVVVLEEHTVRNTMRIHLIISTGLQKGIEFVKYVCSQLKRRSVVPSSQVLSKFKRGDLHSGSKQGKKVTNRKQAVAIMLSEKRAESKHGGKYPEKARREKRLAGKSV